MDTKALHEMKTRVPQPAGSTNCLVPSMDLRLYQHKLRLHPTSSAIPDRARMSPLRAQLSIGSRLPTCRPLLALPIEPLRI